MKDQSSKRGDPSNQPAGGDRLFISMLDAMSVSELTEALENTLREITGENYDPALIDAYLDALDRKAPMPEMPDAKTSYARFQKKLRCFAAKTRSASYRLRGAGRAALAACLAVICMLGLMMAAQAAGVDVFGIMAQWTGEVFSLGTVRSGGVGYILPEEPAEYSTLQEALDAYQVTEVSAPAWIPEGYTLEFVEAEYWEDSQWLTFYCEYMNGDDLLSIEIDSYQNEPNVQIEKTDAPVEVMETDEVTVYLLENTNNNTAVWATEHFEYTISGPIEKAVLSQMALSACTAGIYKVNEEVSS